MSQLLSALCLSLVAVSAAHAAGDVWEVADGGLGLLDAVALASEGDVILVHAGTYPGFTVAGKSLLIVADPGAAPLIQGTVIVHSLAAGQNVTLQGLVIRSDPSEVGVRATLNEGSLWIENCDVVPSGPDAGALQAVQCAEVVLRRSSFQGGVGGIPPFPGASGVILRDSAAALFSCTVLGGVGGDTPSSCGCKFKHGGFGGDGLLIESSLVFLQASTIVGGAGGQGDCCPGAPSFCGDGGNGGAGLFAIGASAITNAGSVFHGGVGGFASELLCEDGADGAPIQILGGTLVDLAEVAPSLDASSPLREGETATVLAAGEPFDLLAVYASAGPALVELPVVQGLLLLQPPHVHVSTAILSPSGVHQIQEVVPELGPSVQGIALRLQSASMSPVGAFVLGEAATLVLLDAGI